MFYKKQRVIRNKVIKLTEKGKTAEIVFEFQLNCKNKKTIVNQANLPQACHPPLAKPVFLWSSNWFLGQIFNIIFEIFRPWGTAVACKIRLTIFPRDFLSIKQQNKHLQLKINDKSILNVPFKK